jgi:hypothetical protein
MNIETLLKKNDVKLYRFAFIKRYIIVYIYYIYIYL